MIVRFGKMGGGGFILPTAVVSGVIMLALLTVSLQLAASSANALREQHYLQLAKEAAEAGMVWLRGCMQASQRPGVGLTYTPNATSCQNPAVNTSQSQYYFSDGSIGMRYEVMAINPTANIYTNRVTSTGYVDLLRPSGGAWRTISYGMTAAVSELDLLVTDFQVLNNDTVTHVIRPDGAVWYWGSSPVTPIEQPPAYPYRGPKKILEGARRLVGCNNNSACFAIKHDGSLWVWGVAYGWSGLGDAYTITTPSMVMPSGVKDLYIVDHSISLRIFVVKDDNSVWAWGAGANRGLLGYYSDSRTPVQILPPSGVGIKKITGDIDVTFALMADGRLMGWGKPERVGSSGGTGTRKTPVVVLHSGVEDVTLVNHNSPNARRTLAVMSDGRVMHWGFIDRGGNYFNYAASSYRQATPVYINGLSNIKRVFTGRDLRTYYAIDRSGRLFGWGRAAFGMLGNGVNDRSDGVPISSPLLIIDGGVVDLKLNTLGEGDDPAPTGFRSAAFALKSDGTLWGWGWNDRCQQARSGSAMSLRPVKIMDGVSKFYTPESEANVYVITSSGSYAYGSNYAALKTDRSLWTWGEYVGDGEHRRGVYKCAPYNVMNNVLKAHQRTGGSSPGMEVIDSNGVLWNWGWYGMIGRPDGAGAFKPGIVQLPDWRVVY